MTGGVRRRPRGARRAPTRYDLWYGRDEPPLEERPLAAGSLSAALVGADLAHVRMGDVALIDRVFMSVRDRDWNTVEPVLSGLTIRDGGGSVTATFDARNRQGDIDVRWRGTVTAAEGGTLTYAMDGEAGGDFDYCRIGFCVLHPAATAAGRPFHAETIKGRVDGELPRLIAPQSIVDGVELPLFPACSRLTVDLGDVRVVTAFEGDLFEMEDQRNWTDASFKTYCTPIALGYPHHAERGRRFHQVVRVSVERARATGASGTQRAARRRSPALIEMAIPADPGGSGPRLGVGSASWLGRELTPREAARLRAIGLDHLRTDVRLSAPDWRARLDRDMRDAAAVGARLEVALFVHEATASLLPELARMLAVNRPARVLVFHEETAGTRSTPAGWLTRVRAVLGDVTPGAMFATGTDGDFAEINRDRPNLTDADAVTYAMNPQVHAFDEASLVETLETQKTTVATARTFAADLAVGVSPVTLRQRFNPAATGPAEPSDKAVPGDLPPGIDLRQPTLFAAGWTVGSYAALAGAGADWVTYFETVGPRGRMAAAGLRRDPADLVPAGGVFPVYHALADLSGAVGWTCAPLAGRGGAGALTGLVMRRGEEVRVVVANVRPETQPVALDVPRSWLLRLRLLDEDNVLTAMAAPARYRATSWESIAASRPVTIRLLPYALARIDARVSTG